MNSKLFGEKISSLRKAKGLTQAQLAEILNVSNKTISRWETGEGYPEITLLVPLAKTLGVTVDALLSDGEPNTNPHQGAEENSFSASSAYSSTYNKGKKEYKHREIPVEWPGFCIPSLSGRFHAVSNFLHVLYFSLFTFILIDSSRHYNYTDKPLNSGIGNQIGARSGAGDFFMANVGRIWLIAMIVSLILLIIFNVRSFRSNRLSKALFIRNIAISMIMSCIVILFGFSFYTGTYGQYSSVGINIEKLFDLAPGNIINCNFIKIESVIIAICGIAACILYIGWEIIRAIIEHKKKKKSEDNINNERINISSTYILFWRSLTIFNKIGLVCVLINVLCTIIGMLIAGFAGMAVAVIIISNIAKAGLLISAVGLVLGILDLYDRQNKVSIILLVVNAVTIYVFPLLTVAMTMVMRVAVSGTTNLIADVNEVVSIL